MKNQIAMNRRVRDWVNSFPGTVIADGQEALLPVFPQPPLTTLHRHR